MARRPRRSARPPQSPEDRAELLAQGADEALERVRSGNVDHNAIAAQCLEAADALRRADRPVRAARMLQRAVDLSTDPGRRCSARLLLAGVLADAGELRAAAELARQVVSQPASPDARILGQDILASALLAQGRVQEARGVIDALAGLAPTLPVLPFRRAALARLDGQLDLADSLLQSVLETAPKTEAWRGPRAAAVMERAELALLQGEHDRAEAGFAAALDQWAAVGRRAGAFRAEAGRVRVRLEAGGLVLPAVLDNPVAYAQQRGMVVLEAELLLARGPARLAAGVEGGGADLDRAVMLAEQAGAVLLEGRCRLARRLHHGDHGDRLRMLRCLAEDRVWAARVPR